MTDVKRLASMGSCARAELRDTLAAIDAENWWGAARHATELATRLHRMDELERTIQEAQKDNGSSNEGIPANQGAPAVLPV